MMTLPQPIRVLVTRDFEQMSDVAAEAIGRRIEQLERQKEEVVLGLATGNSPVGVYARLAVSANRRRLDSSRWRTFNLDEYIGLGEAAATGSAPHPRSFRAFMESHFFDQLERRPRATFLPAGERIDARRMALELERYPTSWKALGSSSGRAIVIGCETASRYLQWIRQEILEDYAHRISEAGGIDLQVLGVGGRGHVAFHEAGIPFELGGLLLVELDEVTREHAVTDGYFTSLERCPRYALTMSIRLVFQAREVIVLASGARKTRAITRSLLDDPATQIPMSYARLYAQAGGAATFVLDEIAARGLLDAPREIARRGIELADLR